MLGFFVGLFGGAYYGGRYLKERSELKAYDRTAKSRKERMEYFRNKYTNTSRGFEIYQYVASGKHFDEICETLKEELTFVFGELYKYKLQIPPKCPYHIKNLLQTQSDLIKYLLLAKEGLVDSHCVIGGYILPKRDETDRRFFMVLAREYAKISSELDLCEIIKPTIHAENLVFKYTTHYDDEDLADFKFNEDFRFKEDYLTDRSAESVYARQEYFEDKYTNDIRGHEIFQYVASGNHFDEICETLKEELIFVFGEDYKNKLLIPPQCPYHIKNCDQTQSYLIKDLLLAKEGLVDRLSPSWGYKLPTGDETIRRLFMVLAKEFAKISSELDLCEVPKPTYRLEHNLVFRFTTKYDDKDLVVFKFDEDFRFKEN